MQGKEEYPATQAASAREQAFGLIEGDGVGQSLGRRGLHERGHHSGSTQRMHGVEIVAARVKLDATPRAGVQQGVDLAAELLAAGIVDALVAAHAQASDGARAGLDGFGLQAFELEIAQVAVVALIELGAVGVDDSHGMSSRVVAMSPRCEFDSGACEA